MRLVLMGAPGAGKGTQAELLARRWDIPHISTGDMLRQAVREGTPMGVAAKGYMDRGVLVPDEITIAIVGDRLQAPDCKKGFILDGFPRNVSQADELGGLLAGLGMPLDAAVNIDVPLSVLLDRACGRRVCSCGATFHLTNLKPQVENMCDFCGSGLIHRRDDVPEVISERLSTYEDKTKPLIEYYKGKGLLVNVDGQQDVESVYAALTKALERR